MSIEKVNAYKVGTLCFGTLEEAQKESLLQLLPDAPIEEGASEEHVELLLRHKQATVAALMKSAATVCAILAPPKELRQRKRRADFGASRAALRLSGRGARRARRRQQPRSDLWLTSLPTGS